MNCPAFVRTKQIDSSCGIPVADIEKAVCEQGGQKEEENSLSVIRKLSLAHVGHLINGTSSSITLFKKTEDIIGS